MLRASGEISNQQENLSGSNQLPHYISGIGQLTQKPKCQWDARKNLKDFCHANKSERIYLRYEPITESCCGETSRRTAYEECDFCFNNRYFIWGVL